jgi:hypothetical protein
LGPIASATAHSSKKSKTSTCETRVDHLPPVHTPPRSPRPTTSTSATIRRTRRIYQGYWVKTQATILAPASLLHKTVCARGVRPTVPKIKSLTLMSKPSPQPAEPATMQAAKPFADAVALMDTTQSIATPPKKRSTSTDNPNKQIKE